MLVGIVDEIGESGMGQRWLGHQELLDIWATA
jgi:hypothetical protein